MCLRVGVAYYDSNTRQLFVLEIWEDSIDRFPLIDLGMLFALTLHQFFYLFEINICLEYMHMNCFGNTILLHINLK